MIDRRRPRVPYKNPHNTSDALLISGTIVAAAAFFWWLSRRVARAGESHGGLDNLGAV